MYKSPVVTHTARTFLPDVLSALWARLTEALQRGRAIDQLSGLSDEQLRDIGLDRRDIGQVIDRELSRLRRSDLAWHK